MQTPNWGEFPVPLLFFCYEYNTRVYPQDDPRHHNFEILCYPMQGLLVILLLRSLTLILPPQNLRLLILNRLVDLCAPRGLVPVHLGRQRGIMLTSNLLGCLLLSTARGRIVLVMGGRKAVCYAALILCICSSPQC